MQFGTKQIIRSVLLVSLFVIGCKPSLQASKEVAAEPNNEPEQVIEKDLVPTWEAPTPSTDKKTVIYEAPPEKIKNPYGEIIYGHAVIEHAKMNYSKREKKMVITGSARIDNEQKKEIAQVDFNLVGGHAAEEPVFDMKPMFTETTGSEKKPLMRARVTCIGEPTGGQYDCNHIVVDFIIRYKKQYFTQQMEIGKDTVAVPVAPPPAPVAEEKIEIEEVIDLKNDPKTAAPEVDEDKEPAEGAEQSIVGPNVAQASKMNLKEIFADDQDAQAEEVKTPPEKTPEKKPVTPTKPKPIPRAEEAPSKGPDKILSKDLKQTAEGNIRPFNQAIGEVVRGRLHNATSLLIKQQALDKKAFFEVIPSKHNSHFGTYELAELVNRLADGYNSAFGEKIFISSVAVKNGGPFSTHTSHQNGTDVDIGYPTKMAGVKMPVVVKTKFVDSAKSDKKKRIDYFYPNNYSVEKTYELFKFAFKQADIEVERIFVDRMIKNDLCNYATKKGEFKSADKALVEKLFQKIEHVDGHGDHFHLRVKCSPEDADCRTHLYTKNNGCGN